jgi:hypothetical protein
MSSFDFRTKLPQNLRFRRVRNALKVDNDGSAYIIQTPPSSMVLATGPLLASKAFVLRDLDPSFQDFIRSLETTVKAQTGSPISSLINHRHEMVLTLFGEDTLFFDADGTYMPLNPMSVPHETQCCALLEIQGLWVSKGTPQTVGLRVKVLQIKLLQPDNSEKNDTQTYHFREEEDNYYARQDCLFIPEDDD